MSCASQTISELSQLYDKRAGLAFGGLGFERTAAEDVKLFKDTLRADRPKVCDIGCGRGIHLKCMIRAGLRDLVGIDISRVSLTLAESLLNEFQEVNLSLVCEDLTSWQVTNCFTGIFCSMPSIGSLGLEGDRNFIQSLSRILSPGGILFLRVMVREKASEIVGSFEHSYRNHPGCVDTALTYNKSDCVLRVHQSWGASEVTCENIHLYSKSEILEQLHFSGFGEFSGTHTRSSSEIDSAVSLPGTSLFLLQKT